MSGSAQRSIDKSGRWRWAVFQYEAGTSDGQGGVNSSMQTVPGLGHVPVQIVPMMSSVTWEAGMIFPRGTIRIATRYRPSVNFNTAQQIVSQNHTYVIVGVINMNMANDMVLFYCEELNAKGSNKA